MDQQHHEIFLDKTYPSGAIEWYCPTCGRRLLINLEPRFEKVVLEVGDEYAVHGGGAGGLKIGAMQTKSADNPSSTEEPIISIKDPSLAPWLRWLDKVDFDELWNDQT